MLVSPGLYFVFWLDGCPDFAGRVIITRLLSRGGGSQRIVLD